MILFPSKAQWKKWSLTAKLTAVGTYIGIIALLVSVIFFLVPYLGQEGKKAALDKALMENRDLTARIADLESALNNRGYHLQGLVLNSAAAISATSSPFFVGEKTSGQIQMIAIALLALGKNVPTPTRTSRQDCYNLMKRTLSLGLITEVGSTAELLNSIDEHYDKLAPLLGKVDNTIISILKALHRAEIRAVVRRDINSATLLSEIIRTCDFISDYANRLKTFVAAAKTTKDALKLVVVAAGSIKTYSDTHTGIETLLRYGANYPPELIDAMNEILMLIGRESNTFVENLSNSNVQLLGIIQEFGAKPLHENEVNSVADTILTTFFGINNRERQEEFVADLEFWRKTMSDVVVVDNQILEEAIQPAYTASIIDDSWHRVVFGRIKPSESIGSFITSLRVLLLVEAVVTECLSDLFGGTGLSDRVAVRAAHAAAQDCLRSFHSLGQGDQQNVDE
jgi:hypothetical protein